MALISLSALNGATTEVFTAFSFEVFLFIL
jgi:hypothetical protein